MASGIPWPRMRSEPYRAMTPTIMAPATGTRITQGPSVWPSGVTSAVLSRWKKKRFVQKPMSASSAFATYAATTPMPMAKAEMTRTRGVVVKSPSSSAISRCADGPVTIY